MVLSVMIKAFALRKMSYSWIPKKRLRYKRLFPGFTLAAFYHGSDADCFGRFVYCTAIFTKWGMAVNETTFPFEIEWFYHELNQVHLIAEKIKLDNCEMILESRYSILL